MAIAILGMVWWFGFDSTDVGDAVLDGIGDLSEHGNAALDGISDVASGASVALDGISGGITLENIAEYVASGASVALDGISDAAREAADMVESRFDSSTAGGGSATDTPENPSGHMETSMADHVGEPVAESPANVLDTAPPPSPFDRTIWPDDTAHDSRQDVQEAEPTPPMQSDLETDTEAAPHPTKTEQIEEFIHTMWSGPRSWRPIFATFYSHPSPPISGMTPSESC